MVFSNAVYTTALWQVFGDIVPTFTAICTFEKVCFEITVFVIIECGINDFLIVL